MRKTPYFFGRRVHLHVIFFLCQVMRYFEEVHAHMKDTFKSYHVHSSYLSRDGPQGR